MSKKNINKHIKFLEDMTGVELLPYQKIMVETILLKENIKYVVLPRRHNIKANEIELAVLKDMMKGIKYEN